LFSELPREDQTASSRSVLANVVKHALNDRHATKLVRQATKAGVEKSVLLVVDFEYGTNSESELEHLDWIHKYHAEVASRHSDKLLVFAGIDPRRGRKGLELFEKCISGYGCRGLKLYPPCGFEIDSPELFPYYDLCMSRGLPVLTHTGPSVPGMHLPSDYPESVLRVAREFRELVLILAHAGILYIDSALDVARCTANVYLDISGFQKESRDVLEGKLAKLVTEIPERILYGSDWPLFNFGVTQDHWISVLSEMRCLNDQNRELLYWKNAQRIIA